MKQCGGIKPNAKSTDTIRNFIGLQQILLNNVFSHLILFDGFNACDVLPSDNGIALNAVDRLDAILARSHVLHHLFSIFTDIEYVFHEISLPLVTPEVL